MRTLAFAAAFAAATATVGASPASADALMKRAQDTFKPIPATAPRIADNPANPAKEDLGKKLFFDPRLSVSGLVSCNTCHNLGAGGVDGQETSIGHGWQKGPRNAPTVLNAVFNVAQFWDGRAKDLKAQAKGPVQAAVEMNATPAHVEATLASMPAYVAEFKKAFPGEASPVTFDNMAKAIESFEATLTTPSSRFDAYLKGNDKALNAEEKQGLALFMDKGCSNCHNGVNVGGQAYFPFGVVAKPSDAVLPPGDKGRFKVTEKAGDEYVFRVAPLRNVALTAPYFHSGKVWSLKEAVGIMAASQLGDKLTDKEENAIVAFLDTLTGKQPSVAYPVLPPRSETTPLPKPVN